MTSTRQLDYDAAVRRVMGLVDFERNVHSPGHSVFHLERMGLLMERLGRPYLSVPTIHVAGTKGKGSTAAMITSILTAAGYTVGLYTSPALHSVRERIRVGLEPVSRATFAGLVERLWDDVDWVGRNGGYGGVTFFELLTAMSFTHFERIRADFQVIEVGLGGRLDATNVVTPEVSVITPIFLDHVGILGDTIDLIAGEKAGIIKPSVPVVVSSQPDEAMEVFGRVAAERGAPLIAVDETTRVRPLGFDVNGQSFEVEGSRDTYRLSTSLLGSFQLENAATAIATIETLVDTGHNVSSRGVLDGIAQVRWPGRLQVLRSDGPLLVVDGAHNPDSVRRLVDEVQRHFAYRRVILVFGASSGHSETGMAKEFAPLSPTVVAVQSRHPKSASAAAIATAAMEQGLEVASESDDIGLAMRLALDMAQKDALVLGAGSLAVAAEMIEEVDGVEPELYPFIKRPLRPA